MVTVQWNVSSPFWSAVGADAFARIRGYLSTLIKQGIPGLAALESVVHGCPLIACLTP
jgi:transposase